MISPTTRRLDFQVRFIALLIFAVAGGALSSFADDSKIDQFTTACFEGNIPFIKRALSNGYDPRGLGKIPNAPIYYAIFNNQSEVVKILLHAGVDPNFDWGGDGGNLLTNAAQFGHLETVKVLVEAGASVNRSVEHSPLFRANITNHVAVEKYLKSKGAKYNTSDLEVFKELKIKP